jgi:hypothetical protein
MRFRVFGCQILEMETDHAAFQELETLHRLQSDASKEESGHR